MATGERHLLSGGAKSSSNAKWSPDGRWIAFTSNRPAPLAGSPSDKQQLYAMPTDGGEAQQLTKMDEGINDFEWSPDSKHLAVSAEASETKAMKDRKDSFGDYQVIHADYQMVHLWLIDLPIADPAGRLAPRGEPKLLTPGETFTIDSFSFSPDGARIAFSAKRDPDLISGFSSDIYTVKIADGRSRRSSTLPAPMATRSGLRMEARSPMKPPTARKYFYYANQKIAIVPSDGGTPRVLTDGFDEDAQLLRWAPEGIYFSALQKTASGLFLLDPKPQSQSPSSYRAPKLQSSFSFSSDYKQVAYRGAGAESVS